MPVFTTNSHWAQWEHVQRQHNQSAIFAMASAQRGFPPTLRGPPSN
jgi:hypothetical protein